VTNGADAGGGDASSIGIGIITNGGDAAVDRGKVVGLQGEDATVVLILCCRTSSISSSGNEVPEL